MKSLLTTELTVLALLIAGRFTTPQGLFIATCITVGLIVVTVAFMCGRASVLPIKTKNDK